VSSGAGTKTLEIILDDKGALVYGTVNFGTKPPSPAMVVLEKWPFRFPESLSGERQAVVENGQFRIENVTPGDYRILAIAGADRLRSSGPGVRERLVADAQKITVTRGVSQTVTVRLAELGP